MLLVLASGCKVIKPKEITTIKDSVSINYRNVEVPVKGAIVQAPVNVDSLFKAFLKAVKTGEKLPEPQVYTDANNKAQLKLWIDQFGKLQASCESKDQVVLTLVAELTKTRQELKERQAIVYKTPTINYIIITVLCTLLLISIIIHLIKF